ncbi:hypothetical protein FOL47_005798 [Perkinsus chesapeaki]|uniref:Thiamine-phosphate synthase n=1 Tax=Perkinsus chesapeaki TaxID=330153 RepID=A0A7J6MYF9_PERCH|nr:hypothetical protein FOL47_005798 [Perkinsus chesapeaki]
MMPDFYEEPVAGGLSEKLWTANQDLAMKSLHHPFVQGLGDGTLDPVAFKTYMEQDSLYLNGYLRGLSYCVAKSNINATGTELLTLLDGVKDELESCHQHYVDNPEASGPEAACKKYVDFLLDIGRSDRGPAVMVAAVIPCARLYAWLGRELTKGRVIPEEHPFRRWLQSYSDKPINTSAMTLETLLDKQVEECEYSEVAQAYRRAMELEYDFFDSFGGHLGRSSDEVVTVPTVLVISGSDSGGGAGHQADLKTLEALGVYSTSALTSITAQNSKGVQKIQTIDKGMLGDQIDSVISDYKVNVVKLGLVPTAGQLGIIADKLNGLPMVVDPVLVATSGDDLVAAKNADDVLAMYKERIFPLATIITPNLPEAQKLLGRKEITGVYEARAAAEALAQYGSKFVLVKGGHDKAEPDTCRDVLYDREHDQFYEFNNKRISTNNTHGTGCTLASAISGFMARGFPVPDAVQHAIKYLHEAILRSSIAGGATCVQLRLKDVSTGDYIRMAQETKKVMPSHVPLIIDDRVDVCLASGADGVHVGDSDMPVKDARSIIGPNRILGVSTYGRYEDAITAINDGADYIATGAVYPTVTKLDAVAKGLEQIDVLKQALNECGKSLPIVAIGGINPVTAVDCVQRGADGVCAVSQIFDTWEKPESRARKFLKAYCSGMEIRSKASSHDLYDNKKVIDLWQKLAIQSPLTQCITNYVSMNFMANSLLAAGASPAMVHAQEEAPQFLEVASALNVNIGTLSSYWADSMRLCAKKAAEIGKPWVLDPVAAGATSFRTGVATELLRYKPTVLRGNGGEILALAGETGAVKGVDSKVTSDAALDAAKEIAKKFNTVVCISGSTDFVTDGNRVVEICHDVPMLPMITATGCTLSALMTAFCAVASDPFDAAVAACAGWSLAAQEASITAQGPGSISVELLNILPRLRDPTWPSWKRLAIFERRR